MDELISFKEWYKQWQESGAMRRLKRDAFERGTMPPPAPASVNSGNTGTPFQIMMASKVKTYSPKKKSKPKSKKKKSSRRK